MRALVLVLFVGCLLCGGQPVQLLTVAHEDVTVVQWDGSCWVRVGGECV